MKLTDEDKENISFSLEMWACYIETGHTGISATEAKSYGLVAKSLSDDQKELVIKLRKLSQRIIKEK